MSHTKHPDNRLQRRKLGAKKRRRSFLEENKLKRKYEEEIRSHQAGASKVRNKLKASIEERETEDELERAKHRVRDLDE